MNSPFVHAVKCAKGLRNRKAGQRCSHKLKKRVVPVMCELPIMGLVESGTSLSIQNTRARHGAPLFQVGPGVDLCPLEFARSDYFGLLLGRVCSTAAVLPNSRAK